MGVTLTKSIVISFKIKNYSGETLEPVHKTFSLCLIGTLLTILNNKVKNNTSNNYNLFQTSFRKKQDFYNYPTVSKSFLLFNDCSFTTTKSQLDLLLSSLFQGSSYLPYTSRAPTHDERKKNVGEVSVLFLFLVLILVQPNVLGHPETTGTLWSTDFSLSVNRF